MQLPPFWDALSPLDHRYRWFHPKLSAGLSRYFSEEASVCYHLRVEIALLKLFARHLGFSSSSLSELEKRISPREVYEEERSTRHYMRALVNVMKKKLPAEMARYVHLGATSSDILDTAHALRVRQGTDELLLPLLLTLQEVLLDQAARGISVEQVGRTHGQHAVPITWGFALAEYVVRLGKSIEQIAHLVTLIPGQLSGATGTYSAISLIVEDPVSFEREFLTTLGLPVADYSNQIVEPESLLRFLLECNVIFGIIANLADDLRHLQRSEIGEVGEQVFASQVGSSTMPQKKNPWNCEHVKSLWKNFSPQVMTFYMDQLSEHQRDLTNSASKRFQFEYLAGLAHAIARMRKIVEGLVVDKERLALNLTHAGESLLAEPLYILLSLKGVEEAHELVRQLSQNCPSSQKSLLKRFQESYPSLWAKIKDDWEKKGLPQSSGNDFSGSYTGKAVERASSLIKTHRARLVEFKKRYPQRGDFSLCF